MIKTIGKAGVLSLGMVLAAAFALPTAAVAHGHGHGWHGGHGRHHHGHYDRHYNRHVSYRGGHRGGYWHNGRWVADAIVTGAVVGLISNALRPAPVVYAQPRTVVYESAPVTRRVVTTRTVVYDDPYGTRYIRDDGWDD